MNPAGEAERLASGGAVPAAAAGAHDVGHHAIARRPALDAVSDAGDPTHDLDAEHVRWLDREAGDALANVDVEMVQRRGDDLEHDLAGTCFRVGELLQAQNV